MVSNLKSEKEQLAEEILLYCKQKIHKRYTFFSQPLYVLKIQCDVELDSIATDGYYLFYNPDYIIKSFKKDRQTIYLAIIHVLLHCLLRHFAQKKFTNYPLYDATTDVVVYFMLYDLSFIPLKSLNYVLNAIPELNGFYEEHQVINSNTLYNTALNEPALANALIKHHHLFMLDNHIYWTFKNKNILSSYSGNDNLERNKKIWYSLQKELHTLLMHAEIYEENGFNTMRKKHHFLSLLSVEEKTKSTFSYQEYLKRLASLEEFCQIDYDSFDPLWYTTGLNLYEDIPIIEYNEYKEDYLLSEFVLAIDTSGSCSGEIMSNFLSQTKKIFDDMKIANRQINVTIIQCDDTIVHETVVKNYEDVLAYTTNYKAHGFGGTRFEPVFDRITELQDDGQLLHLKGLIYLSDGCGSFPESPPEYETIFVLPEADMNSGIPRWVTTVLLEE